MYFWDAWAKSISQGDWLNEKAPHPITSWQTQVAEEVLSISRPDLGPDALKTGEPQRALWNSWFAPKAFHQEPLYVYMVAATYVIAGARPSAVAVWQLLAGVISVYFVFDLAQRHFGRKAAILAGTAAALCPLLIFYQVQLLRETLVVLAGLLIVRVTEWALERDTPIAYGAAGIVCGLAILAKSHFVVYPLLAGMILAWGLKKTPKRLVLRLLAGACGVLLAVSPAMARNAAVGAPLATLSANQAWGIVQSNCDDYLRTGGYRSAHTARILHDSGGRFFSTWRMSLATHPDWLSVLSMYANKFRLIWHWTDVPDNSSLGYFQLHSVVLRFLPVSWGILVPIGLAGVVMSLIRKESGAPALWPLVLMLFCSVLPMVLFATLSRFRAPLAAVLIPFAGLALVNGAQWIRARRWQPLAAAGAGMAVLLAVLSQVPAAEPIRPTDYTVAIQFHYWPLYRQALAVGDFPRAVQVADSVLKTEPEWIGKLGPQRRPRNDNELLLAHVFCEVREWRVDALERAGKHEQANAARAALADLLTVLSQSDAGAGR